MKFRVAFTALLLLLATGCIPILIHSAVEANSMEKTAYSSYLDTMRNTNTQREIAGLPVERVLTRAEWKASLGTPTNAPAYAPNDPRHR